MSQLSRLRKQMGYETDVPRCENCAQCQKPYIYLTTNSNTKKSPPFCKLGKFAVQVNSCCDKWQGKDGSRLKGAPQQNEGS